MFEKGELFKSSICEKLKTLFNFLGKKMFLTIKTGKMVKFKKELLNF